MIEVSPNHLLLQIESKSFKLSCIRFVVSSSCKTYKKEKIMNYQVVWERTAIYQTVLKVGGLFFDFSMQFIGKEK